MEEEEGAPINELPAEILVRIVSRLSLRDAVRTSVVCKRWRNVWTFIPALNFTESRRKRRRWRRSPADGYSRKKWGPLDSFNYSNWVCGVLAQRSSGSRLDVFRVSRCLDHRHSSRIDDWIRHAFSSRVRALELILSNGSSWAPWAPKRRYTLQHPKALMAGDLGFKFLKVLSLGAVNAGDEVIQYFLSNCHLLEALSLNLVFGLRNLKVIGPSLLLRDLRVKRCENIEAIGICDATKLVAFSYAGPGNLNMVLRNAPKLVKLSLEPHHTILDFQNIFPKLSCCFSQLKILDLRIASSSSQERLMDFVLPELTKLVAFVCCTFTRWSPLHYVAMIKNLPNLRIFILAFPNSHEHVEGGETDEEEEGEADREEEEDDDEGREEDEGEEEMGIEEREAMLRFRHPCLTMSTIFGYCRSCDLELFKQMIENAPQLRKIDIPICAGKEGQEMERSSVEQQLRPLLHNTRCRIDTSASFGGH